MIRIVGAYVTYRLFHSMFGNKDEMMPAWPMLSRSPILTLFGWSTLAHDAFEKNRHLFSPAPLIQTYSGTPGCPRCVDPYAPLEGLLAIHIRRGDFLEHCPNLCHWSAGFNAFNQFDGFPDPWEAPGGSDDERMAVYLRRCVPTISQIVAKIEEVRRSNTGHELRNIYIMTNGDRAWLEELKDALLYHASSWERVTTSRDLTLTLEQKYVSQSIDMLIGERAQVLIGNGVSLPSCVYHWLFTFPTVLKSDLKHCNAASVKGLSS